MEIDEIERKISYGEMSAAQVFTQMRQHTVKAEAKPEREGILVIDGLEISRAYNVENEKCIMLDFHAISGSYIDITLEEADKLKKFLEYNIRD